MFASKNPWEETNKQTNKQFWGLSDYPVVMKTQDQIPSTHVKKLGITVCACNPGDGNGRITGLAANSVPGSVRNPVAKE